MTALHYAVEAPGKAKGNLKLQGECPVRCPTASVGRMHAENQVGQSPVCLAGLVSPIMYALFKRYVQRQTQARKRSSTRLRPLVR